MSGTCILVTGTHRSGTTWVGEMLALDPATLYIHEPFNAPLQRNRGRQTPVTLWYQKLTGPNATFEKYLLDFQKFKPVNILYNSYRRNPVMSLKWFRLAINKQSRFLYKDPLALLSAPWFATSFHASVVVLIRHPAAFAASLKVKNWNFPFMDIVAQPDILDHIPQNWREGVLQFAHSRPDIVSQAALLWNILHYYILQYKELYPDWCFIRHEDLSKDPVNEFHHLYDKLGLSFSDHIVRAIERSTAGDTPVNTQKTNVLRRDSAANIRSWEKRLTIDEIKFLKEATSEISSHFYTEEDW